MTDWSVIKENKTAESDAAWVHRSKSTVQYLKIIIFKKLYVTQFLGFQFESYLNALMENVRNFAISSRCKFTFKYNFKHFYNSVLIFLTLNN